jgi:cytochrome P450
LENKAVKKQQPRAEMMFWRFTGTRNVALLDGTVWEERSHAVRSILHNNVPLEMFASIATRLLAMLNTGGRINWSDLTHRFALDVVGSAIMGYDFEALEKPNNSLVQKYRDVMANVAHPLYVSFPILEILFPRKHLLNAVNDLREEFRRLMELKRQSPGSDFISILLEQAVMSDVEYLDNVVTMFMAGHVSHDSV